MKNYTGKNWWESEAGKYLKSMMKDGANINLQEFSKLDSRVFLKEITRRKPNMIFPTIRGNVLLKIHRFETF